MGQVWESRLFRHMIRLYRGIISYRLMGFGNSIALKQEFPLLLGYFSILLSWFAQHRDNRGRVRYLNVTESLKSVPFV